MSGRRWLFLVIALVAIAAVMAVRLDEPELVPVSPAPLTIAGSVVIEPAGPSVGSTVVARATISADRAVTLSGLTVRVRDDAGAFHDFPVMADVALGVEPRVLEWTREFTVPGGHSYYLAYRTDGEWVNLPPWQRFAVG